MRGGKRDNAGVKSKFEGETVSLQIRVPLSKKEVIKKEIKTLLKKYERGNK